MTVVQEIITNWETMTPKDFDEFMLYNKKALIREEKEQIIDAYNNEGEGDGDRYYTENYID
jgi:predicted neutral ceramidase superfamily lipid hydrolase